MENLILFNEEEFAFQDRKSFYKFSFKQLELVVCNKPYLEFHIEKRVYLLKGTVKSFAKIESPFFIQINRTTFVNVHFIKKIVKKKALCEAHTIHGNSYRISCRRYKGVLAAIKQKLQDKVEID